MKLSMGLLFLGLSLPAAGETPAKKTVSLQADVWCPFNCKVGAEHPGYMIEIARIAFASIDTEVDYQTISWTRAIALAREGKINGIVGASTSDAPDFVYPAVPLGVLNNCFYTMPDSKWTWKDVKSLDEVKVGIIKGYSYGEPFDEYIKAQEKLQEEKKGQGLSEKIQSIPGDQALGSNIKKIQAKRIDVFIEEQNVLKSYLFANKLPENSFRNAGCIAGDNVFVAFGPSDPKGKEYAKILGDTVTAMRKDGRLKKILEQYGLKDWAK